MFEVSDERRTQQDRLEVMKLSANGVGQFRWKSRKKSHFTLNNFRSLLLEVMF